MLSEMSEGERQILYDITYLESGKAEFTESEAGMVIPRGWCCGWGAGEMLVRGHRSLATDE